MARLRYTGAADLQLPTPFGYLVHPGDVAEIPDHLLYILRQPNIGSAFGVMPDSVLLPPFDSSWRDADAEEPVAVAAEPTPVAVVEAESEPEAPRRSRGAAAQAAALGSEPEA